MSGQPGGNKANKSGSLIAEATEALTNLHGYTAVNFNQWQPRSQPKAIVRRWPYRTVYGTTGYGDACLVAGRKVWIEAKRQMVSGSVDEKFPYMFQNAKQAWSEEADVVAIILQGEGFKPGAVEWLKREANNHNATRSASEAPIYVFSIGEFIDWVAAQQDLK